MSRFFIDRPIFAWVIAIIIMLAGVLSITRLPVSQYPNVAPPAINIAALYSGADAKTVQDSVTQVIEQSMSGLDNLLYMSSSSDSSGSVQISLTFKTGTNPDTAQVQVQNKLQAALPLLPQEVQQQGVRVAKSTSSILMAIGMISTDGSMTQQDIADYINTNVKDPISRTTGVGDIQMFGAQYAMRIWLDPNKLTNYQLTTVDVIQALRTQNAQVAAGQIGGTPAVEGQQLNAPIIAQTRLNTPQQFSNILLKVNKDGSQVRLKDVSRVELGGENYSIVAKYNDHAASGFAVKLAANANALQTAGAVRETLSKLEPFFPRGLQVIYPYDTTPFVKISINEVVKTLAEAILLVFLVMYLFLQNLRATLIPTIAVPVVLLGTFGVLNAFGYSINTLTMFAMVLAIGLLVDDAIVVVENVERVMAEEHLSPKEATRKSMGQIQGALVGIALVLSAVFVPMAFTGGATGEIYRQFSITIVSAMVLSVLVALVLTPALCATMLKPVHNTRHQKGFFAWFNRLFEHSTHHYTSSVQHMLSKPWRHMLIYMVIIGFLSLLFYRLPSSFLPSEDQGVLLAQVELPAGASQQRTQNVLNEVSHYLLNNEKNNVASAFTISGFSFSGQGQNMGLVFIALKDWSQRTGEANSANAIATRTYLHFAQHKEARIVAFNLPAIAELGTADGFNLQLIDQANLGHEKLIAARNQLLKSAAQHPDILTKVRPNGQEDSSQYKIDIDQEKAMALGISISDINNTLNSAWGGIYVNDFVDKGRVKKVYLMADAPYRMLPSDLDNWYVRGASGNMVPFSAFSTGHWLYGSPHLERYNGLPSTQILGNTAAGGSSGKAMALIEQLAEELPTGIGYAWDGISYQEKLSGNQVPALIALSTLVVFLCLAALYESWSIPFSVMLVVPLGMLGAVLATSLWGLERDVYFIVGLLTTIGLSAKNAILIVEFAKDQMEKEGKGLIEGTLNAVRLRLRPILMTSLAFILGVLPLVISTGAGSGAQNAVGTGVMGGMISATVLAIFFVPVLFVLIKQLSDKSSSLIRQLFHHNRSTSSGE